VYNTNVGTEWLVDAEGCTEEILRDGQTIRRICEAIIADLRLHVIGEGMWHQFPPPCGVTGLYLLTESHLACHTYPETGFATFNLYCCRPRERWNWEAQLGELLGAKTVTVTFVDRGSESALDPTSIEADRESEVAS